MHNSLERQILSVEALLRFKADVNIKNYEDKTALMLAVRFRNSVEAKKNQGRKNRIKRISSSYSI